MVVVLVWFEEFGYVVGVDVVVVVFDDDDDLVV